MLKYTEHCDLCKEEFEKTMFTNNKNGFSVELGYSLGGWGSRRDFTEPGSMEICDDCFEQVEEKAKELADVISKLNK